MYLEEALTQARANNQIAARFVEAAEGYVGYDFTGPTPRRIVINENSRSHSPATFPVEADLLANDWDIFDDTQVADLHEAVQQSTLEARQAALQSELESVQTSLVTVQAARAARAQAAEVVSSDPE